MLMAAQDAETGMGMSDTQLRDEAMTLFVAGHETTASHLAWTLWLLDQNREWRTQLIEEVETVLEGRTPTLADLGRLTVTRQIVDESLRLFPPGWIFGRRAINDDKLLGYDVRAGTTIVMSPYVVQRRPDLWANASAFDPSRFAESAERHRFAYWPFGGGPRQCIGNQFALMESTLTLAMIHQWFTVDIKEEAEPLPSLTLRPKNALTATLYKV